MEVSELGSRSTRQTMGWLALFYWPLWPFATAVSALMGTETPNRQSTVTVALLLFTCAFEMYAYVAAASISHRRFRWVIAGCMVALLLAAAVYMLVTANPSEVEYTRVDGGEVRKTLLFSLVGGLPLLWLLTAQRERG